MPPKNLNKVSPANNKKKYLLFNVMPKRRKRVVQVVIMLIKKWYVARRSVFCIEEMGVGEV